MSTQLPENNKDAPNIQGKSKEKNAPNRNATSSSITQTTPPPASGANSYASNNDAKKALMPPWLKEVGEIIVVISAFALVVVDWKQWKEMSDERLLDERAWLMAIAASATPNSNENEALPKYFVVEFKNSGKTPAKNVRASMNYTVNFNSIPQSDTIDNDLGASVGTVAPDGTTLFKIIPQNDIIQSFAEGKGCWVFGTIWYDDIFGEHHWSQFCLSVGNDLKTFAAAPIHNNCDDSKY
jgi:hypothetical protein